MTQREVTAGLSLVDAQQVEETKSALKHPFPIVAIGASAGGVEALTRLLTVMPCDTGCAFIVVLHLALHHVSNLAELLGRATAMPVKSVRHGARPKPNHVYVIPPGQYLTVRRGRLHLEQMTLRPLKPETVDRLLVALATEQRERAIAVILTGTDGDGSLGVKAIKSEGGMTIAQTPSSAAYPQMPAHAIETGQIDRQLELEAIPAAIVEYVTTAKLRSPDEPAALEPEALGGMLEVILHQLGLNFSGYKTAMLSRRIRRRMGLGRIEDTAGYLRTLQSTRAEVEALAADFLISVTDFFREPESWAVLKQDVLPTLFAEHAPGQTVRAWVPACATGEEAYSLAMVLIEGNLEGERRLPLQLFATDIDKRALSIARKGEYPKAIERTVTAERLHRFFVSSKTGYTVRREVRELITFAPQNIVTDPPFSRIDLVSCRNLLIYMQPSLQRRVLQMIHFALERRGYLALGKSETVSALSEMFAPVSTRARLFRRVTLRRALGASVPIKSPGHRAPFEQHDSPQDQPTSTPADPEAGERPTIDEELSNTKRDLRHAIEELETANEELKVANEEAVSTNEELQSTNEELETSKEELHSVNEELLSVNQQLQSKIQELERLNNDLVNLLTSTNIPTLFLDRQLNIKRFTPAATKLFTLIASDVNRPLTDIASHGDLPALLRDARRVLEDLTPLEGETATTQGEHYLRRITPYRTHEDRIDGVVVTFTDITRLKLATEGMRRFAAVMEGSVDAIVIHDLEGTILAWNHGAQVMYGYPEAEVVQRNIASLMPEEARPTYLQEIARVLADERPRSIEVRRRRRDGSEFTAAASVSLITGDAPQARAVALIERDVTPRQRAENDLRESELRFRTLADSAPVLIWLSDSDGVFEFVNKEFSRVVGLSAERLSGHRWLEFVHRDDVGRMRTSLGGLSHSGDRLETTLRLLTESGSPRWMKVIMMYRPQVLAAKGGVIGSMVDISAQIAAEEGLREGARQKDEFLAMLGHELRNPLAPIRNAAEVLHRIAGDDQRLEWAHTLLVRQVGHMTRLIEDLLDISRITRGTLRLRLEPVDLRLLLERALATTKPILERKHHRLEASVPPQPVWVEGDPIRLTQIFENLLTNAAKYTDEHGEIAIALEVEATTAMIRVRDNGLGISPTMRTRIFELFVQDERSVDRSQGGLGIGLALVRHLVDLHRGSVEALSTGVGRGSEFVVRLPLLPEAKIVTSAPRKSPEVPGSGRVLVVDDDVAAGGSLAVVLRLFGYEVEHAVDLESALRLGADFRPQAVVMDIALPHTDGYEVARRLRALPHLSPHTAFIGVSGFGQQEDFRRSEAAGFIHHLIKPIEPAELDEILKKNLVSE